MNRLSGSEIEKLASRPGVRRIAVENFLGTMDRDINILGSLANLRMDARLYKWNRDTVRAISDGIKLAYR